jgi:hypothetical protein
MNPYLEQPDTWQDFHLSFMAFARDLLTPQVRPAFVVKIEEHIYVHEPDEDRRLVGRADVSLARPGATAGGAGATALLSAPARVRLPIPEIERSPYLEIRDRLNRRLVCVIELLSPSCKCGGDDREQYLHKRGELLRSPAHFVEIDLRRGGERLPVEDLPPCDYYALVSRAEDRPEAGSWPLSLRDRLPVIPIPLEPPHADARLDLQEVLHRAYDSAGYEDYIYLEPPEPPLSPEQAAWAQQFIPART